MPIPDPSDTMWGPVALPDWVEAIRPHQWDAVQEVTELLLHGTGSGPVDVVFLEAPTGSGKSLIAELVRRRLGTRAVYSCTTKALQHQIEGAFDYAKVVKGRANYLTQMGSVDEWGNPKAVGQSDITCADCTWQARTEECRWCVTRKGCPYQMVKTTAQMAELAVVNTSYLLTVAATGGQGFHTRGLSVIDEADTLESELLSHAELVITKRRMERLGLEYPAKKTVESAWVQWAEDSFEVVQRYLKWLTKPWDPKATLNHIRHWNGVTELYEKLAHIKTSLPDGGWVYDGYKPSQEQGDGPVIFRPVQVGDYGHQLLWANTRKSLLMSATILSDTWFAEDIGLVRPYSLVKVPSTFPVANRPIHYIPVADMRYDNREVGWDEMVDGLIGVANRHPDDRILVHTVSYRLAQHLYVGLKARFPNRPIYTYNNSGEKDDALRRYKGSKGGILLASSMDRGIDLPDDFCRVQVVAKIPYPNIKDRRINARMRGKGGSVWYRMQAIRSLVQMTGRGVRSETDHAVTYILDQQFALNLWKNGRYLFPSWWAEALSFRMTKRHLLGPMVSNK